MPRKWQMHHLLSISSVPVCLGPCYLFLPWSPPTLIQAFVLQAFLHMLHYTIERTFQSLITWSCHCPVSDLQWSPKAFGMNPKFLDYLFVIAFFFNIIVKEHTKNSVGYWIFGIRQYPFLWTYAEWFAFIIRLMYAWEEQFSLNCFYWSRWELTLIFQSGNLNFSWILGNSNADLFLFLYSPL